MDELLVDFLSESSESLAQLDNDLVILEKDTSNTEILNGIFRTLHTIKGTCGFLGLQRLELVAHAGESVLVKIRDNQIAVTSEIISLIFQCLDVVKDIVEVMAETGCEPGGNDNELIAQLNLAAEGVSGAEAVDQKNAAGPDQIDPKPEEDDGWASFKREEDIPESIPEQLQVEVIAPIVSVTPKKPEKPKTDGENANLNQNVRVNIKLLENLMATVSDLVQTRNQLFQVFKDSDEVKAHSSLNHLSHITSELQAGLMKTRLQPISNAWAKIPRLVRDLAQDTGKIIELEMIGEETELDRQVIESIKDPLTHMIRNSADHGLESTQDRILANKPEAGKITLKASHGGGFIIVEISDNGRGLPIEKIKEKAVKNGIVTPEQLSRLSESQIFQFIFSSGFSTAEKVTNISGRGVGMDVVRSNIEKIGGTVEVKSVAGKGSAFTIKIPLTVAIVSVLIAEVDNYRFAIQQLSILELVKLSNLNENKIEYIYDRPVLRLRDKLIPLIDLGSTLNLSQNSDHLEAHLHKSHIIVLEVGTEVIGLIVDKVHDIQEIVVKPVPSLLKHIPLYSGNTILGDGSVIMIIDPNGLTTMLGAEHNSESLSEIYVSEQDIRSIHQKDMFLIFHANDESPKAIPLSVVNRLETISMEKIEFSDSRAFTYYRGNLVPLSSLNSDQELPRTGIKPAFMLSNGIHTMGLIIDEIVDIIEEEMNLNIKSDVPGKLGTIILKDHATDIIDLEYFFQQAYPGETLNSSKHTVQKSILYIGDNAYGIGVLTPLLQSAGYHILKFDEINQARHLISSNSTINTIIVDFDSPAKDFNQDDIQSLKGESAIPILGLASQQQLNNNPGMSPEIVFASKNNRADIIEKLAKLISDDSDNAFVKE